MDVGRRENVCHLGKDIGHEHICAVLAHVHFGMVIAHPRIGGNHLLAMGRELYLGHNGDAALLGIGNQLAHLLLSVVTAKTVLRIRESRGKPLIALGVLGGTGTLCPPFLPGLVCAPCAKVGKTGILLYLQAPSCRIGKMQVQDVEPIVAHQVYLALQHVHGIEMAAHINHQSTPLHLSRFLLIGLCA